MNPGDYKSKIDIQKNVISIDEIGNQKNEWQTIKTIYASVNSLYGKEYFAAAAVNQQDTIIFTLRYSKLLQNLYISKELTACQILFQNINYKIIGYDNVKFENKIIKIKAVRI